MLEPPSEDGMTDIAIQRPLRNVRSGDRYLLEYLPGIGLRLSLNDEKLGTVGTDMQGAEQGELARIMYSVWFGDEAPFSASMKKELLTPLEMPVEYFSESKCAQSYNGD